MRRLPITALLAVALSVSAWNVKEKYDGPKTPTTDIA